MTFVPSRHKNIKKNVQKNAKKICSVSLITCVILSAGAMLIFSVCVAVSGIRTRDLEVGKTYIVSNKPYARRQRMGG